jgi:protein-histidine pros-kinase
MKLRTKFNVVLGLASIVGIVGSAVLSYYLLQANAREEVLNTARIMMDSAIAVRNYTINEVKPLLAQEKKKFLPQTVPAYSANRYISELQKTNPDYSYKEATLNPTNLSNRATDWEVDVVTWFKNHNDQQEFIGERDNNAAGRMLYMSKPIKITNPSCLGCHSTPAQAPKMLIEAYGDTNGFGWKMDEIIGAQIVSVPMSLPLQRAEKTFYSFLISIISVFIVIGILLNILLHFIVIKPMVNIAKQADKVSMGELNISELAVNGNDEIASVSQSFNRMHRSLINAFSMLDDADS